MAGKLSSVCLIALIFFAAFANACDPCAHRHKPSSPKIPPKGPPANPFCPRDTLKLGVCADLLGGLVNLVVGTPSSSKCCTLIQGLVDLEAAACLCTAIKANVLGINLNLDIALSLLVSACEKSVPPGFKCV
ncbi:hypothetical protein AQUCO_12000005v1 [Aquilegia coerulea]|uniref:Bifunctional inhibitor/plant lipid transfer protein/seed storage helical domain-containing protein n=1 Tax=Aquilegia coerulea TaxID=218851 RepID=A0A2G5C1T7_AQUCA|nr:hypothetical protein AQUCO_12000005v1 [Aquilegia coerulea]